MTTWTVSAPARLHFGLLDLTGDHGRIDGGSGVAISSPRVTVRARRVAGGALPPEPVAELARRLADRLQIDLSTVELELAESLPEHVGLGSHTALALALGTAMARAALAEPPPPEEVARAAGRGGTSGIGVHAFARGGLVVEGGHSFGPGREKEACGPSSASRAPGAPLLARFELPEPVRFALVTPRTGCGANGAREVSLFAEAFPLPAAETGEVCRRVLLGLMPAAARSDVAGLGAALRALQDVGFKRREVALLPAAVRELLDVALEAGAAGAGLSSFGPTVYALCEDESVASAVVATSSAHLRDRGIEADGWVAAPDNLGAVVTKG